VLVFSSRLEIVACLANGQPMSFTELSKTTEMADGNLHVQTRKLADAGYIRITQTRGGGRSRTMYQITDGGERRLRLLIATLEQSLERPPTPRPAPPAAGPSDRSRVW
jgi:DNA-binding PadR family transcriptional regulator